jgi:O-antigen/teichoic acid export membrane protein
MNDKPITTSRRLAHNTLSNVATLIVNSVIQFFLIRFFLGQLGENQYGVWLLVASVFQYRDLLGLGLNSAINRYIPVYLAKGDEKGIQRVISTSLVFFATLGFVLVAATIVVYFNIGSWFTIEPELVGTAGRLVLVVGLCGAFALPMQPASAVLSGLQRYDIINIGVLVPVVVRAVLLVVLLRGGCGLITMGLIFGLSEILMRLLQLIFAGKLLPRVSISLASVDLRLLKEMLAYGINTFLYATGVVIIYKASDVIIGIFIGTAEISQFAITTAVILLLSQFLQAFTQAIKPAVSDLDARDEHSQVREISLLMQKYSLLLIIPPGCFFVVMGREFLWVWVGEKFRQPEVIGSMSVILSVLTVGQCLRLAQYSNFLVLVGKGDHRIFGILTVITAIFCVTLSVLSIKVLKLGLIGIAWSNSLPVVITSGIILPIYFNWKMRTTIKESVTHIWLPAFMGTLPAVVLIIIWQIVAPPNCWAEIFAVVITSTVVTFVCSWFLSFSELERKRFLKILVPLSLK